MQEEINMKENVANWDRALRWIVGVILLAVAIINYNAWGVIALIPAFFGVVLILVAAFGYCFMYDLLKIKTLKK